MSVLGLFVLRGLLVTLAVRQPFVVMNGPSSSRVAMNVDNTVSAGQAAQAAQRRGQSTRAIPRLHATRTHARRALSLSLDHRLRAVPAQQAAPCAVWHPMQDVEDASTSTSTSTTSTSTSRIVVSMPEPLLPAPQRSACCHRSQLAAGHARSFWAEACAAVVSTVGGRVALPC